METNFGSVDFRPISTAVAVLPVLNLLTGLLVGEKGGMKGIKLDGYQAA
jgi:hypothetical protein